MKDQYVGDISDYEKYATLRALRMATGLPLAVCWMLTPPDATRQGGRTAYLDDPVRYRAFDAHVFDRLKKIVHGPKRNRTVRAVEQEVVLECATFFPRLLEDNADRRRCYFSDVWETLQQPSIQFFDPDIGLSCRSIRRGRKRSSMYVFDDELAEAFRRGHSLVIFDHWKRVKRSQYLEQTFPRLLDAAGAPAVFALWSSRVIFFVLPQRRSRRAFEREGRAIANRWQPMLTFTCPGDLQRSAA